MVVILLTLSHLGIKNIKVTPTLRAFITPNVLNFLQKTTVSARSAPEKEELLGLIINKDCLKTGSP